MAKKKIQMFLGHLRISFKSPALLFFLLLSKKEKEKKTLSLGRCGPLPVMLASLFILDSISGILNVFLLYFVSYRAPTV